MSLPDRRTGSWTGYGAFAVIDQALFAGAHFSLNILLARWMDPAMYGAFASAYSLFVLLVTVHHALFVEPMLVFGPGRFEGVFGSYVYRLIGLHSAVAAVFGLAVLATFVWWRVSQNAVTSGAFLGVSLAGGFILVMTTLRRALFATLRPVWAAVGGGVYASVLLTLTWALQDRGGVDPLGAMVAMGCAAILASVVLSVPLVTGRHVESGEPPTARTVVQQHWNYGRWALVGVIPVWLAGNIYYVLLPVLDGLESAGAFKALANLMMPMTHLFTALSMVVLPALVRARSGGEGALFERVRRVSALFLVCAVAYLVLVLLIGNPAILLLYGGQYDAVGLRLLMVVGLVPFGAGAVTVFATALRAMERPDRVVWGHIVGAMVAVVGGIGFTLTAGLEGALFSLLLASVSAGTAMFLVYKRSVKATV